MFLSAVPPGGVAQQAEHLSDHAELNPAGTEGKVQGTADEQGDEDIAPEEIVGGRHHTVQPAVCREDIGHGFFEERVKLQIFTPNRKNAAKTIAYHSDIPLLAK